MPLGTLPCIPKCREKLTNSGRTPRNGCPSRTKERKLEALVCPSRTCDMAVLVQWSTDIFQSIVAEIYLLHHSVISAVSSSPLPRSVVIFLVPLLLTESILDLHPQLQIRILFPSCRTKVSPTLTNTNLRRNPCSEVQREPALHEPGNCGSMSAKKKPAQASRGGDIAPNRPTDHVKGQARPSYWSNDLRQLLITYGSR